MQASEMLLVAEHLLSGYREALLIDPFFKVVVDSGEGAFTSKCEQDSGALAWRIRLNPEKHQDLIDVKYSIVDGLLRIMFAGADRVSKNDGLYQEARDEIVVRLTTVLCNLLPDDFGSDDGASSAEENEDVSD